MNDPADDIEKPNGTTPIYDRVKAAHDDLKDRLGGSQWRAVFIVENQVFDRLGVSVDRLGHIDFRIRKPLEVEGSVATRLIWEQLLALAFLEDGRVELTVIESALAVDGEGAEDESQILVKEMDFEDFKDLPDEYRDMVEVGLSLLPGFELDDTDPDLSG